jgi:predicted acylesterase/phospholipase RssA
LNLGPAPPPTDRPRPTLIRDFPYRRVAVVLSGGGAFGAYEIGVFRALEALGLRPAILAGVSVGAINAVVWLAHGFRTGILEQAWSHLRGSSIGMRWATLVLRAVGVFIGAIAAVEILLTLAGSPELNVHAPFRRFRDAWGFEFSSMILECLTWLFVGMAGIATALLGGRLEEVLARLAPPTAPEGWHRWLGRALLAGAVLYLLIAVIGIPWPWRFHAVALAAGIAVWLANRPGRPRDLLRRLFLRLLPETRGRGLWGAATRRRLIEALVAQGNPARLVQGDTHLIISACSVDDGRMSYFVNWRNPAPQFRERVRRALGEVVEVLRPEDVVEAVVAASAVPVLFEPARFREHEYLDGGVFSNQPLHAVVADGADAILLVLVSPSSGPRASGREANAVELVARLQGELQNLPQGWSRAGDPARVCVVEPNEPLPGRMFGFDPANAVELMRHGERDGWLALERAGWLEHGA